MHCKGTYEISEQAEMKLTIFVNKPSVNIMYNSILHYLIFLKISYLLAQWVP